jgi:hypothetical protein
VPARGHGRCQGRDKEERDLDIDGEGLVELGFGSGLRGSRRGDAGVVDENVDVALAGLSSPRGQVTGRRCAVECG